MRKGINLGKDEKESLEKFLIKNRNPCIDYP